MGKLKVLPASIANMIAAGEVVQRPASVVKELMENAVDAGATQVSVSVTDAGRTLIQVVDDGCGMSPADAVLCFERHATSKIAVAGDLEHITSYGFRGEALPSIAAVSEVTLKTRRPGDDTATQVAISGGNVRTSSVTAPTGTGIAVRNLFYNTPARRKFLKSDNVELKHIVDEFTRVAVTRPDIGFTLTSGGRDLFVLRKAKSLKFRVLDLLGKNVAGELVDIEADTMAVKLSGFIARPDTARKTVGNQFFFVNGRYFRSPFLHKAVMKAYEEYIADGLTPSYFIWLDLDPGAVDVNIHPSKAEVKFEEDSVIFQVVYACVKATLGRNAFGTGIDFDTEGAVQMPQLGRSFEEYRGPAQVPGPEPDGNYDPFAGMANAGFDDTGAGRQAGHESGSYGTAWAVERRQDYGRLFEESQAAAARALVVKGRYIVIPSASGIMLVHIRRAWERIIYEESLRALSSEAPVTQTALFPVQVQVGTASRLLFDAHAGELAALGFDIAPFGNDTVVVNGVPQGWSCEAGKVEQMVRDICLILSDGTSGVPEVMHAALAAKFATLGALNAQVPSGPAEAQALVDRLFACDNSGLTSSGKRITVIVDASDIDKKFA